MHPDSEKSVRRKNDTYIVDVIILTSFTKPYAISNHKQVVFLFINRIVKTRKFIFP